MASDENDYVMKDFKSYSLKEHNTFGIEAKCSRYIEFENREEAVLVAGILRGSSSPCLQRISMVSWCAQVSRAIPLMMTAG